MSAAVECDGTCVDAGTETSGNGCKLAGMLCVFSTERIAVSTELLLVVVSLDILRKVSLFFSAHALRIDFHKLFAFISTGGTESNNGFDSTLPDGSLHIIVIFR